MEGLLSIGNHFYLKFPTEILHVYAKVLNVNFKPENCS